MSTAEQRVTEIIIVVIGCCTTVVLRTQDTHCSYRNGGTRITYVMANTVAPCEMSAFAIHGCRK